MSNQDRLEFVTFPCIFGTTPEEQCVIHGTNYLWASAARLDGVLESTFSMFMICRSQIAKANVPYRMPSGDFMRGMLLKDGPIRSAVMEMTNGIEPRIPASEREHYDLIVCAVEAMQRSIISRTSAFIRA